MLLVVFFFDLMSCAIYLQQIQNPTTQDGTRVMATLPLCFYWGANEAV
jgi:hypothetical protein